MRDFCRQVAGTPALISERGPRNVVMHCTPRVRSMPAYVNGAIYSDRINFLTEPRPVIRQISYRL
ncbi:hypothetical protein D3C85_656910 [compost metagenome]